MKTWPILLLLLIGMLFALHAPTARAQSSIQILDPVVEYVLSDQQIVFRARLEAGEEIQGVNLLFESSDGSLNGAGPASVDNQGNILYVHQLQGEPVRAFSPVQYSFQVLLADGRIITTPAHFGRLVDSRFQWETLSAPPFGIHWYDREPELADDVLLVARSSLEHIQELIVVPNPEHIDLYIYNSIADLQSAMQYAGESRIAGHADPDLGVILLTLPEGPEQRLALEQRVPHEMLHVLLYNSLGDGYTNLPVWLREGLATAAELYPNPDYQVLLNRAHERRALLPIADLCQAFPRDASNALLAYAEAGSFTRYLHIQYGAPGLQSLAVQYADGAGCEDGITAAFNQPLNRLERQWRQELFAEDALLLALGNLLPWLALMLVVLLPPLVLALGRLRRKPPAPQTAQNSVRR